MNLFTETEVRRSLQKAIGRRTLTAVGKDAGVSVQVVSMAVNGAPITGKLLAYIGYEKVRERLYRRRAA